MVVVSAVEVVSPLPLRTGRSQDADTRGKSYHLQVVVEGLVLKILEVYGVFVRARDHPLPGTRKT